MNWFDMVLETIVLTELFSILIIYLIFYNKINYSLYSQGSWKMIHVYSTTTILFYVIMTLFTLKIDWMNFHFDINLIYANFQYTRTFRFFHHCKFLWINYYSDYLYFALFHYDLRNNFQSFLILLLLVFFI